MHIDACISNYKTNFPYGRTIVVHPYGIMAIVINGIAVLQGMP